MHVGAVQERFDVITLEYGKSADGNDVARVNLSHHVVTGDAVVFGALVQGEIRTSDSRVLRWCRVEIDCGNARLPKHLARYNPSGKVGDDVVATPLVQGARQRISPCTEVRGHLGEREFAEAQRLATMSVVPLAEK